MSRKRPRYLDRSHAGAVLAAQLQSWAGRPEVLVLALPRGGVPVAVPVAAALVAPWAPLVVRKLGVPGRPELAMGAVASVGGRVELVRLESVIASTGVTTRAFEQVEARERAELDRRVHSFAPQQASVAGRVVIVVDDGLATGSTMLAAVRALRAQRPQRILVAVPVAARQAVALLAADADEVVCPCLPEPFLAVGTAYADFRQVSEDDLRALLTRAGTP